MPIDVIILFLKTKPFNHFPQKNEILREFILSKANTLRMTAKSEPAGGKNRKLTPQGGEGNGPDALTQRYKLIK